MCRGPNGAACRGAATGTTEVEGVSGMDAIKGGITWFKLSLLFKKNA